MDGVGVGGCVWRLRIVGGATKEGKGGNVAIDREDFGEKIGGVDEAGEEDKAEKVLARSSSSSWSPSSASSLSSAPPRPPPILRE